MGVTDLWTVVRKRVPRAFEATVPARAVFSRDPPPRRVVVDGTGYLYRFAAGIPPHPDPEIRAAAAVDRFKRFVARFSDEAPEGVTFVIVWDGAVRHPLKAATTTKRATAAAKRTATLRARVSDAERSLSTSATDLASFRDAKRSLEHARDLLERAELPPRGHMERLARTAFEDRGGEVAHVVAEHDADFVMSRIARDHPEDTVVLTEDSDLLAMGARLVVRISPGDPDRFVVIERDAVLAALGMDLATFQTFCVLLGTDFCDRVPRCGPVFCESFVQRHRGDAALNPAVWPSDRARGFEKVGFPDRHRRVLAEFRGGV